MASHLRNSTTQFYTGCLGARVASRTAALTCVYAIVRLQLVLEAEPLPAAIALVRLLPRVDALVAPQGPVVSEAAPTVFTFEGVVA